MTYTVTDYYDKRTGVWFHVVRDDNDVVVQYADDRTIDSGSDSWEIAIRAASEAGLPGPDWVDHDGEFIHFGHRNDENG